MADQDDNLSSHRYSPPLESGSSPSRQYDSDEVRATAGQPGSCIIPALADWSQKSAWAISVLVNPLLLSAVLLGLVSDYAGAPRYEVTIVYVLAFTFLFVMPVGYLYQMKRQGLIQTMDVRDRMQRRWPLIISLILMFILLPSLLAVARASAGPVLAAASIITFNTALLLVVTVREKISLHSAGMASFASILLQFSILPVGDGLLGGAALLVSAFVAIPLVMWARIKRGAHSLREVLLGTLFGLAIPPLELTLLWAAGIF